MKLPRLQESKRRNSSSGERTPENRRKIKPGRLTIGIETSPAVSVGEFETIIAYQCATMSMDAIDYMLDLCSKRTLYGSLWYLEGREELVVPSTTPLFIRYLAPDRRELVREMIRERIDRLEEKSVKAFDRRMRNKVAAHHARIADIMTLASRADDYDYEDNEVSF